MIEEGDAREQLREETRVKDLSDLPDSVLSEMRNHGDDADVTAFQAEIEGEAATVWTKRRVYFTVRDMDYNIVCRSVSRNHDGKTEVLAVNRN